MNYFKVQWLHEFIDEPIYLYSEGKDLGHPNKGSSNQAVYRGVYICPLLI